MFKASGMFDAIRSPGSRPEPCTTLPTVKAPNSEHLWDLQIGDLVFIRVTARPFLEVANANNSFGVVVGNCGDNPLIAESTFPFSRTTQMTRFLERSEHGRYAVTRLTMPLNDQQRDVLVAAAARRMRTL